MSSGAKSLRKIASRKKSLRKKEENRIVVQRGEGVTTIRYRGSDPETRYLPPEPSVWRQIRERFRLGRATI
jgi:hypothetical protein